MKTWPSAFLLPPGTLLAIVLGIAAPVCAAPPPPPAPFEGRFAFRTYADEDGLANSTVECLLQDRQGFLWVGTQDGLFRFEGRRFLRFGRGEGLPSSRINALHETAGGRLYAGTHGGLAGLAPGPEPRFVGVLPAGDAPRPTGWWQRPLGEGEGRWLRLVVADRASTTAGDAAAAG